MSYQHDPIQTAGHVWQEELDGERVEAGAAAISDLLTMLGVDPDERQEHGGPTTAETLVAAVVRAIGADRLAAQIQSVREYGAICRRGSGSIPAGDVWWKLNQITGASYLDDPIQTAAHVWQEELDQEAVAALADAERWVQELVEEYADHRPVSLAAGLDSIGELLRLADWLIAEARWTTGKPEVAP